MPLTRATVTVASRIMLPTYVLLVVALGLIYLLDPLDNLRGVPALAFPRLVVGGSMAPWGLIFLSIGAVMGSAFATHSRIWFCFGLCLCAVTFFLWAGMYVVSLVIDPDTSLTAPLYPLFVSTACAASTFSLLAREA